MICPTLKQCSCENKHFHILVDRTAIAAACDSCGTFIVGTTAIKGMPDVVPEGWKFTIEGTKKAVQNENVRQRS